MSDCLARLEEYKIRLQPSNCKHASLVSFLSKTNDMTLEIVPQAIAPLETIDFSRLVTREPSEVSRLLKICETQGFFYLDLQSNEATRGLLTDEKTLLRVMEKYWELPLETKMKDQVAGSVTHGYKPLGAYFGVQGSRDAIENLKIGSAEMAEKSNLTRIVAVDVEPFDRFMSLSKLVTETILYCLTEALRLDDIVRYEGTRDTLCLYHYPKNSNDANVGLIEHTDIGFLTLLLSDQWGLQVVNPVTGRWNFVQPKPNHAVINVGDALRFLSGKRLFSCLHRVTPLSGKTQKEHRYSVAYFMRPESEFKYEDADGNQVAAEEYMSRKYEVYIEPHEETRTMLTGGMEQVFRQGARDL